MQRDIPAQPQRPPSNGKQRVQVEQRQHDDATAALHHISSSSTCSNGSGLKRVTAIDLAMKREESSHGHLTRDSHISTHNHDQQGQSDPAGRTLTKSETVRRRARQAEAGVEAQFNRVHNSQYNSKDMRGVGLGFGGGGGYSAAPPPKSPVP